MEINFNSNEFYELIKQAIREVFKEEKMNMMLSNVEKVSNEEMDNIKKLYGEPEYKKETEFSEEIDL